MKKILSLLLCILTVTALISTAAYAVTPIDTARPSSLTLQYSHNGKYFEGLEIKTYRIAEVFEDGTYALTGDFADYPVKIYDVTSQAEWRIIASTLAAYAEGDKIAPTREAVTDARGIVEFKDILPGMYLTLSVTATEENTVTVFETFLAVVPRPSNDGNHNYDVTAFPKCETHTTGGNIEYKIVKLWKDEGHVEDRPKTVVIDILKDGVVYKTLNLSASNSWSLTWEAKDDGAVWYAVERELPVNYTVASTREGNTFVITNSHKSGIPESPQTGDTSVMWPYALVMCLSGGVLVIVATWRKRREV